MRRLVSTTPASAQTLIAGPPGPLTRLTHVGLPRPLTALMLGVTAERHRLAMRRCEHPPPPVAPLVCCYRLLRARAAGHTGSPSVLPASRCLSTPSRGRGPCPRYPYVPHRSPHSRFSAPVFPMHVAGPPAAGACKFALEVLPAPPSSVSGARTAHTIPPDPLALCRPPGDADRCPGPLARSARDARGWRRFGRGERW
jgi:hypothetical protein